MAHTSGRPLTQIEYLLLYSGYGSVLIQSGEPTVKNQLENAYVKFTYCYLYSFF